MLHGKTALITGCARGIGHAIMQRFGENGANLFACTRTPSESFEQQIASLRDSFHIEVIPVYFEMSDPEAVKNAAKTIAGYKKKLDVIVNNAGITANALFSMTSMTQLRSVFEVNFFGPFQLMQYLLKRMNPGGSIINISSSAALEANSGLSAYASSKMALLTWSRCLARELGDSRIRVNVIAPGVTRTDILSTLSAEVLEQKVRYNALKRMGTPAEIANTALFLASDRSNYITGQVFRVDGGL